MAADNASAANNRRREALLNDLHNTPVVRLYQRPLPNTTAQGFATQGSQLGRTEHVVRVSGSLRTR